MKIGMVSEFFYPQPGGISEHIRALSRELRLRGHEVTVITSEIHGSVEERDPRVIRLGRSIPVRYNGAVSRVTLGRKLNRRMRALLEAESFDLLHIHNPHMPTLPLLALKNTNCPVVGTFHSNNPRDLGSALFHPIMRRWVDHTAIRIAVSRTALKAAARHYPGDYRIVPNGVDYEFYSEAADQSETHFPGLDPTKKKILFVGAAVKRKGLPYLLNAFTLLREKRDDLELVIVGDGPCRRRQQNRVPSELAADVHFVGTVPRAKLADYYASADIFCAPSLGQESFGMVLLEAMAAGLPVSGFAIDGYTEVVKSGEDGILVPPKDVKALAESLAYFLDSREECARFGHRGQIKARAHDWSEIARQVETAYREALGEPHQEELPFGEKSEAAKVGG
jgi:phosphatidyl-myo-inositol alpha-mannosyltransferase